VKTGQNAPEMEQNQKKPEISHKNLRKSVDKALQKVEGDVRRSSSHPHEY
jgi:hypothetical protein